jgi:hypothetical protein
LGAEDDRFAVDGEVQGEDHRLTADGDDQPADVLAATGQEGEAFIGVDGTPGEALRVSAICSQAGQL